VILLSSGKMKNPELKNKTPIQRALAHLRSWINTYPLNVLFIYLFLVLRIEFRATFMPSTSFATEPYPQHLIVLFWHYCYKGSYS
jgi:hypothetical protein